MYKNPIILRDFARPIRERHSKHVGPYYFGPLQSPPKRSEGWASYEKFCKCEKSGETNTTFRLRIKYADIYLRDHRLGSIQGYWVTDDCDESIVPVVLLLPKGRGYLSGWSMGDGMCCGVEPELYSDPQEAAIMAHQEAERVADRCREDEEKFQRELKEEEAETERIA